MRAPAMSRPPYHSSLPPAARACARLASGPVGDTCTIALDGYRAVRAGFRAAVFGDGRAADVDWRSVAHCLVSHARGPFSPDPSAVRRASGLLWIAAIRT